jgi:hypothetical protein
MLLKKQLVLFIDYDSIAQVCVVVARDSTNHITVHCNSITLKRNTILSYT